MSVDAFPMRPLGPLCSKIGSGATPRGGSKVYLGSGRVALIRSQNVRNERFDCNGLVYITEEHARQLVNVTVEPGDVLLNITGDSVARCCQVDSEVLPARVNQHVAIVRPRAETLDPRFLRYFLISPGMQAHMLSWAGAGATRNAITKQMIESFSVPCPSIEVQQAIATTLGDLDDKIELNRRMSRSLESIAQTLFKSWFIDFDPVIDNALRVGSPIPSELEERAARRAEWLAEHGRSSGQALEISDLFPDSFQDSELGPVPASWTVSTIGSVANVIDCLHSPKPKRLTSGRPLLQLGNIRNDGLIDMTDTYFISESDYEFWVSRMEASPGDCVVTNVGRVGIVAQIPEGLNAALGRNMTGLRCMNGFPFPTFLLQCLLSEPMREEVRRKTDTGTILDALNVRSIPRLRFVCPNRPLLARFEELARPIRKLMESALHESQGLAQLRETLLPRLINGKMRVPVV